MASITVEVPDELLAKLKNGGGEVSAALRLAAAFSLCGRGELSTSQAARLAGMTYGSFLEAASRAKVVLFPVDLEELREEVTRGFTLGRQRLTDHPAGEGGVG
jgi:predicted HTH domain antitoxin